jgi:hypothetical protein
LTTTTHRVYGVNLRSEFDFAVPLSPTDEAPDVDFVCQHHPPIDLDLARLEPVLDTVTDPDWADPFHYHRLEGVDVARLPDHADYYLFDDRIVCHLLDPEVRYLVENHLFGTVFALWLERRGVLAFHASAVAIDDVAVAFVAPPQGGKTSMACALAQAGFPLLTEDLLPVRTSGEDVVVDPGYPMVRMWPEQARWFTGDVDGHPLVHPRFDKRRVRVGEGAFAAFRTTSAPLRRLYLLDRDEATDTAVGFEPVASQEALIELLRASFLPVEVERYGWQRRRLAAMASLLTRIEVSRLRYPSGLERLPAVIPQLLADLQADDAHGTGPTPAGSKVE